jgi:Trp operon repressor
VTSGTLAESLPPDCFRGYHFHIIRQQLKTEYSSYEVLQILGSSLLDKTPINQLLKKQSDQDVKELLHKQLKIW